MYALLGGICGTVSIFSIILIGYDRYNVIVKGITGTKITKPQVIILATISEYQMPNNQKSLNDQKIYDKQLGQLFFFSKISNNFTIKLILKFNLFLDFYDCSIFCSFFCSLFFFSFLLYPYLSSSSLCCGHLTGFQMNNAVRSDVMIFLLLWFLACNLIETYCVCTLLLGIWSFGIWYFGIFA